MFYYPQWVGQYGLPETVRYMPIIDSHPTASIHVHFCKCLRAPHIPGAQLKHKTRPSGSDFVMVMFRLSGELGWQLISISIAEQSPVQNRRSPRTDSHLQRKLHLSPCTISYKQLLLLSVVSL